MSPERPGNHIHHVEPQMEAYTILFVKLLMFSVVFLCTAAYLSVAGRHGLSAAPFDPGTGLFVCRLSGESMTAIGAFHLRGWGKRNIVHFVVRSVPGANVSAGLSEGVETETVACPHAAVVIDP